MAEEQVRYYEGIGRRKRSSARVRIYPGQNEGIFTVNGKDVKEYFPRFGDYITIGWAADRCWHGKHGRDGFGRGWWRFWSDGRGAPGFGAGAGEI
jgi:hypothetical protein